jgi:hypothetical protein
LQVKSHPPIRSVSIGGVIKHYFPCHIIEHGFTSKNRDEKDHGLVDDSYEKSRV